MTGGFMTPSLRHQLMSRRRALVLLAGTGSLTLAAACAPIESPAPAKPTTATASNTGASASPAVAANPATAAKPGTAASPVAASSPAPSGAAAPAAAPASAAASGPSKTGGTLTIGSQSDIINFDAHALPAANWPIFQQIFSPLIRYDVNLKPQPELAESWQLSGDGLTLTMKLMQGVKFHSGRDFTAEDVLWNLKRIQDPAVAANSRVLALAIKNAQAVDPHTVTFTFDQPTPGIFDLLDIFYVMDKDVQDVKNQGAGTGPFKVASWSPGDQLKLVRHEAYFKPGLPRLNEVIIKAMPDSAGRIVTLESGAIEIV